MDIQTHTSPKSDDRPLSPEQLTTETKRVGLDGICLTDHDGVAEPDGEYGFRIFPGCGVQ